jgi:plasmid stabilization system protein ParE
MTKRSLVSTVVLGIVTLAAGPGLADVAQSPSMQHRGDYLPWRGGGFGGYAVSGPASSQQQPQVYDIAPAVAQAAFSGAEYDNRWVGLQVMLERARSDFYLSADYLAARKEVAEAQRAYDSAADGVLSRLANDKNYRDLIEQRTEEQIALKSTGVGSGLRNAVAAEKLRYGSMVSRMEAFALANDSGVQDARKRLVAAQEAMTLKGEQFESQLFRQPEVAGARESMEEARANKAGAEGYLRGAVITRADQIDVNAQMYGGNSILIGCWNPYYRGYFGFGGY